jgi:uncharacterized heparinase superfamily protein
LRPAVPGPPQAVRAQPTGTWQRPAARTASIADDGVPVFLNIRGQSPLSADWSGEGQSLLWQYNLHYFDDLNASHSTLRRDLHHRLIADWVKRNPPATGVGWEPYPTSLRIVNWVKWSLRGNALLDEELSSLALQAAWLSRNIEWHLLGNHLFSNGKALVFAGMYFDGPAPRDWLQTGLDILSREIREQVLADGGHFELSPMYHSLALEDILDLVNLSKAWPGRLNQEFAAMLVETAEQMLDWLDVMSHPDGEIALLNDSAFGVAPSPVELIEYASRLGINPGSSGAGVQWLEESGYVRGRIGSAVLIADIGKIGPDYLPAHAHADTLSFELSLFDCRFIVDAGCSTYDISPERLKQRGTTAHNTVVVNGEDSSEVWGSFRVARRAKVTGVSVVEDSQQIVVSAGHDGYSRFVADLVHERRWRLDRDRLTITDRLPVGNNRVTASLLLHPDVAVTEEEGIVRCRVNDRQVVISAKGGAMSVSQAAWHPRFNSSVSSNRICITMYADVLETTIAWS